MPGAGAYDPKDFKSIGIEKITGGAPANFLILARAEIEGKKPKFPMSPRFDSESKKGKVGPGAYDVSKTYMSHSNDKKTY